MAIPLEDNFTDIIGKAQRGLAISDSQLAQKSGVPAEKIRELRDGSIDDEALARVAPVLNLAPAALIESAHARWKPRAVRTGRRGAVQHALWRHDGKRVSRLGS